MACSGAASAALAAIPIGVVGQAFINGGIGFAQAGLNGEDMVNGFEAGFVAGVLGGPGFIPFLPKEFKMAVGYYVGDAIKAVIPGVAKGNGVSLRNTIINYGAEKVKGWFSDKKQDNSDAVPAT